MIVQSTAMSSFIYQGLNVFNSLIYLFNRCTMYDIDVIFLELN